MTREAKIPKDKETEDGTKSVGDGKTANDVRTGENAETREPENYA